VNLTNIDRAIVLVYLVFVLGIGFLTLIGILLVSYGLLASKAIYFGKTLRFELVRELRGRWNGASASPKAICGSRKLTAPPRYSTLPDRSITESGGGSKARARQRELRGLYEGHIQY
jgi:hypothetical protein